MSSRRAGLKITFPVISRVPEVSAIIRLNLIDCTTRAFKRAQVCPYNTRGLQGSDQKLVFPAILHTFYTERQQLAFNLNIWKNNVQLLNVMLWKISPRRENKMAFSLYKLYNKEKGVFRHYRMFNKFCICFVFVFHYCQLTFWSHWNLKLVNIQNIIHTVLWNYGAIGNTRSLQKLL